MQSVMMQEGEFPNDKKQKGKLKEGKGKGKREAEKIKVVRKGRMERKSGRN